MKDIYTYILWLQVFANVVSVIVTFKIGRLKLAPTKLWFTLSASLFMALLYRVVRVFITIPSFTFFQTNKETLTLVGDIVILPLVAFFIMVFTIQIYSTIKKRN